MRVLAVLVVTRTLTYGAYNTFKHVSKTWMLTKMSLRDFCRPICTTGITAISITTLQYLYTHISKFSFCSENYKEKTIL